MKVIRVWVANGEHGTGIHAIFRTEKELNAWHDMFKQRTGNWFDGYFDQEWMIVENANSRRGLLCDREPIDRQIGFKKYSQDIERP